MAGTDFTSAPKDSICAQKSHIYDLLNRLNAAYARVHRNMEALEAVGIFDPLMMQNLNRQHEQLRAGTNHHLLGPCGALKNATGTDSRNHPMSKNRNQQNPAKKMAGLLCYRLDSKATHRR